MTILDRLEDRRVMNVMMSPDKKIIEIEECCDREFAVRLNKKEAEQLLSELKEVIDSMVE